VEKRNGAPASTVQTWLTADTCRRFFLSFIF
jgi:hypothetical protein